MSLYYKTFTDIPPFAFSLRLTLTRTLPLGKCLRIDNTEPSSNAKT